MATDYDAPRVREGEEPEADSIEELRSNKREAQSPNVDAADVTEDESFQLPGADLSGEVLEVEVVPIQADEYVCSQCFLVHSRSAVVSFDPVICRDCA